MSIHASDLTQKRMLTDKGLGGAANASAPESALPFPINSSNSMKQKSLNTTVGRTELSNIDLNYAYDDCQDRMDDLPNTSAPENLGNTSPVGPLWLYKDSQRSSPPQNSGNSGSTSSQSPSTSSGEAQV